MVEKAWWREPEAAGHIVSAIRKQRNTGVQLTFPYPFRPNPQPTEQHHAMLKWVSTMITLPTLTEQWFSTLWVKIPLGSNNPFTDAA